MEKEVIVSEMDVPADAKLPTLNGHFRIRVFHEDITGFDHVALTLGDMSGPDPVLVRVHSECLTGDAFNSLRCDCGPQLESALQEIQRKGWGCLFILVKKEEGLACMQRYRHIILQDKGADTLMLI